jgi:hypothetical protein
MQQLEQNGLAAKIGFQSLSALYSRLVKAGPGTSTSQLLNCYAVPGYLSRIIAILPTTVDAQ